MAERPTVRVPKQQIFQTVVPGKDFGLAQDYLQELKRQSRDLDQSLEADLGTEAERRYQNEMTKAISRGAYAASMPKGIGKDFKGALEMSYKGGFLEAARAKGAVDAERRGFGGGQRGGGRRGGASQTPDGERRFKNKLEERLGKGVYRHLAKEGQQDPRDKGKYSAAEIKAERRFGQGDESKKAFTERYQGLADEGAKFTGKARDFLKNYGINFNKQGPKADDTPAGAGVTAKAPSGTQPSGAFDRSSDQGQGPLMSEKNSASDVKPLSESAARIEAKVKRFEGVDERQNPVIGRASMLVEKFKSVVPRLEGKEFKDTRSAARFIENFANRGAGTEQGSRMEQAKEGKQLAREEKRSQARVDAKVKRHQGTDVRKDPVIGQASALVERFKSVDPKLEGKEFKNTRQAARFVEKFKHQGAGSAEGSRMEQAKAAKQAKRQEARKVAQSQRNQSRGGGGGRRGGQGGRRRR